MKHSFASLITRPSRSLLFAATLGFCSLQCASANSTGCASMVGGGLTFLAGLGGFLFPPTLLGTGGIVVGELAGAGTDVYKLAKNLDPGCPAFLASPPVTPDIAALATFDSHVFPTFALTGGADDPYISTINGVVVSFNRLSADVLNNASGAQLNDDLNGEAAALQSLAAQLSLRPQGSTSFSQADFDAGLGQIRATGLPGFETTFLQSAGWTVADIAAFTAYTAGLNFQLAVPTVTATQLELALASEVAGVPEPNTLLLILPGCLAGLLPRALFKKQRAAQE